LQNCILEHRIGVGAFPNPDLVLVTRLDEARKLNVVGADSSAKNYDWKALIDSGPTPTKTDSVWDPYKQGCN
jgi:hypothetical protein